MRKYLDTIGSDSIFVKHVYKHEVKVAVLH